jgi:hypothetical protein
MKNILGYGSSLTKKELQAFGEFCFNTKELKCEYCGKRLTWGKNKGMFQTGRSEKYWHYTKRRYKQFNTATFCSRECCKRYEALKKELEK